MSTPPISASANDWGYRPELDGLRSIAVYLVILFHSGSTLFQGGFIGVDLFFVLSGFLVSNVLLTDMADHGRIRFTRFYARRARRLIPAAAVAVVGTSIGALLISTPVDRLSVVDDARAASLWFANWHFLGEANNYFEADSLESPFLHFWSLSIEEQFYLAFPLVLVGLFAVGKRRLRSIAAVVALFVVAGVAVQLWRAQQDTNVAYLATDARVYQILCGVLLSIVLWAYPLTRWVRPVGRIAAPLAVLALIVCSTRFVDVSASSRGLLAAAMSVAVILSFECARGGPLAAAMSAGPVRYLGQISYGTYLWHWPIIVLAKQVVELDVVSGFLLSCVGGTALAALSNELIERPVRSSTWLNRRGVIAISGGVTVALVSGLLIAPKFLESPRRPVVRAHSATIAPTVGPASTPSSASEQSGLSDLESDTEVASAPEEETPENRTVPNLDWAAIKADRPDIPPCENADGSDCLLVAGGGPSVLIVGDSHGRMLVPAFEAIAERNDLQLSITMSASCPWQRDLHTGRRGLERTEQCLEDQPRVLDELIARVDPDLVIVAGFPRLLGIGAIVTTVREELADQPLDEAVRILGTETVDAFVDDGRVVVMVEPVPVFQREQDQLACLSGARTTEECLFAATTGGHEDEIYREIANGHPDVFTLDIDRLICPRLPICDPIIDGTVVRRDSHHITGEFAASLTDPIAIELDRLGLFESILD